MGLVPPSCTPLFSIGSSAWSCSSRPRHHRAVGVTLAHRLSKRKLETAFGIFLLLVSLRFLGRRHNLNLGPTGSPQAAATSTNSSIRSSHAYNSHCDIAGLPADHAAGQPADGPRHQPAMASPPSSARPARARAARQAQATIRDVGVVRSVGATGRHVRRPVHWETPDRHEARRTRHRAGRDQRQRRRARSRALRQRRAGRSGRSKARARHRHRRRCRCRAWISAGD